MPSAGFGRWEQILGPKLQPYWTVPRGNPGLELGLLGGSRRKLVELLEVRQTYNTKTEVP